MVFLFLKPRGIWGLLLLFLLGGIWASFHFIPVNPLPPASPNASQGGSREGKDKYRDANKLQAKHGSFELVITAPVQFVGQGLHVSADLLFLAGEEGKLQRIPTRLNIYQGQPKLLTGDVIRVWGRILPIGGFQNFGMPNPNRQYQREGIECLVRVGSADAVVVFGTHKGFWPLRPVESMRYRIREFLTSSPLLGEGGFGYGLLRALIIGDRSGLGESTTEAFRQAGLAHLLAISGQHVGLVAIVFFFLCRGLLYLVPRVGLWVPVQKLAWFGALVPTVVYVGLAGFPVSALRALILLSVFAMTFVCQRSRDLWSALALAGFVILLMDPASLFSSSFQLSFVAVAAMILFLGDMKPGILSKVLSIFFTSLIVTFLTAPLLAYYFRAIPLAGLLANVIAIPLLGIVVLPLSLLTIIVGLFSQSVGTFLLSPATQTADVLIGLARWFSSWELSLPVSLRPIQVVFCYISFSLFLLRKEWWKRSVLVTLTLLVLLGVEEAYSQYATQEKLRLTMLDVGQGDAILLELPAGEDYLIDGGGFYIPKDQRKYSVTDIGKRVILPYLKQQGIDSLEGIILSHPHPDHYEGLISVVRDLPVKHFYWNGDKFDDSSFEEMMRLLREKKVGRYRIHKASDAIKKDSVMIQWLGPKDGVPASMNDRSLVMRIDHGEICFLLTGDIEASAEKRLVKEGQLECDILKAPHHGSNTSSTMSFINAIKPKHVLISAGANNPFGQPDKEVIDRYKKMGIPIWRTDRNGAIRVISDGEEIEVETVKR